MQSKDTVLVTGGAGFIGSHVVPRLLEKGYRVVCVDSFNNIYDPSYKEENIKPFLSSESFTLARVDIRDMAELREVFTKECPRFVIHLAGLGDTRAAVSNPHEYVSINVTGTINVLELSKEIGVHNVVLASSSSVYGNTERLPWKEDENADRPLSPYGATKRMLEMCAYTYHHNFSLNTTCLRYFNAYGERNRPGMVPYIWTEALLKGKDIEISGDGSRKRDYTYVGDVAEATVQAMEKPLGYEIINVGNSKPFSLLELLLVFEKVTGEKANRRMRPSHSASIEVNCADISKAKKILNWEPKVSLEEGVGKLVTWFTNHRLKD